MLSTLRRHMTYANVAATLALVFAMSGGALAASRYLITSTKQIKPNVIASLRGANGKPGANGANGAQGAAGAQGPAGPAGGKGDTGEKGSEGSQGPQGPQGPKGEQGPQGTAGAQGQQGAKGDTGPQGITGPAGSPWTAGGTLPVGATETGAWLVNETGDEAKRKTAEPIETAISFPIPLVKALINEEECGESNHQPCVTDVVTREAQEHGTAPAACKGSVESPTAESGHLCVYISYLEGGADSETSFYDGVFNPDGLAPTEQYVEGTGTAGAILSFFAIGTPLKSERAVGAGTWAVTG